MRVFVSSRQFRLSAALIYCARSYLWRLIECSVELKRHSWRVILVLKRKTESSTTKVPTFRVYSSLFPYDLVSIYVQATVKWGQIGRPRCPFNSV